MRERFHAGLRLRWESTGVLDVVIWNQEGKVGGLLLPKQLKIK